MQSWKMALFPWKNILGKVNIKWSLFQGAPLLFVVVLIPVAIILRTMKQGYSFGKGNEKLNHLLFMANLKLYGSDGNKIDSLFKVITIVSGNIGMKCEFDKCDMLKIKRRMQGYWQGIYLGDDVVIEEADEEGILKSKLSNGNVIIAIIILPVTMLWYRAGIIYWNKGLYQHSPVDRLYISKA